MEFKTYLAIFLGNIKVIVITLLVTLIIVVAGTFLVTPVYSAYTTLRIAASSGTTGVYADYVYADRLLNTYVKIATSGPVLDELVERLGMAEPPEIQAESVPTTELIKLTVEHTNPALAQDAANTLGEILVSRSKELYIGGGKSQQEILSEQLAQADADLQEARQEYEGLVKDSPEDAERIGAASQAIELKQRTYNNLLDLYEEARIREAIKANIVSVVEPAVLPDAPIKPNKVLNIALGVLAGLIGGGLLILLLELLKPRFYTTEQIEAATALATLGKIPAVRERALLSSMNGKSPLKLPFDESFRRLRANLLSPKKLNNGTPQKVYAVASAEPGEGKSTIAANLARAIAQTGQRVVLVDADMRLPSQHKIMGLTNQAGLSSILLQETSVKEATQESVIPGLDVITSGPLPAEPCELLGSSQMEALIEHLKQQYDIVMLDTPALMVVADTSALIPWVDSLILVIRRAFARQSAFREICKQLGKAGAPLAGLVINQVEEEPGYYYSYHRSLRASH